MAGTSDPSDLYWNQQPPFKGIIERLNVATVDVGDFFALTRFLTPTTKNHTLDALSTNKPDKVMPGYSKKPAVGPKNFSRHYSYRFLVIVF